jgi:Hsp20/alpha crystallin family
VRTSENAYRISLAVAGFKPDQISVTVQQNTLVVAGRETKKIDDDYVHRGIAARDFERRFSLADFVEVKEASFEDGLLQIDLVRELPEAMKPRRIEVRSDKNIQRPKRSTTAGRIIGQLGARSGRPCHGFRDLDPTPARLKPWPVWGNRWRDPRCSMATPWASTSY